MTGTVIHITGSTDYILNYLLSFDAVAVIESDHYIKESPTITIHIAPHNATREKYAEKIIEGKLVEPSVRIPTPKVIAIEKPTEITEKMKNFVRGGGVIILFEISTNNKITVETIE